MDSDPVAAALTSSKSLNKRSQYDEYRVELHRFELRSADKVRLTELRHNRTSVGLYSLNKRKSENNN